MKRLLKTGKKTLSVIMAVLMVMTAWVWVAPTEAEAANGDYNVRITWKVVEAGTFNGDYNNKSEVNDSAGFTIYYAKDNGRGDSATEKVDIKETIKTAGEKTSNFTLSGFPTEFYASINDDRWYTFGITGQTIVEFYKIEVKGVGASSYKTIWDGTAYLNSTNQFKNITINADVSTGNDSKNAKVTDTDKKWIYPYVPSANQVSYDSDKNVSAIGIPPLGDNKDTSISTRNIQYYALDYYGARYEPTSYVVSGVEGLTKGTGWSCGSAYPITATNSTTKSTVGVSQTATVTMNWNNGTSQTGQKANTTATFQVYNPRYKVTYNGNGGTLGTGYTYAYYGRAINHSTSTATSNNVEGLSVELLPTTGIKEGYTFNGMYTTATGGSKISATQTVSADVTYYAHWDVNNYTATFYGTKVNDAGSGTVEYVIESSNVNYGNNPVAPSTVDGYSFGDYDYVFDGWDKAIGPIGVNGAEYRATYKGNFVKADYSAVDDIVAEANVIINGANYEAIYSEESRHALENALNSVVYDQGRTNQAVVDSYVPLIREAIDGLGRQKYSVVFIDGVDNSVIELRYPVYYGDAITMPDAPSRGFTTTDHYVFREWATSENGDNINFVEKNMIIVANYDKIAHTYTDTPLDSNCTTQAGVLHKCSCGYEYVEYSGSVGTEHNLEAEFTIDIEPTCTSVGSKSRHCTRCAYREEVTEIPALGHDYTDGYQGVVINPGCENDGAEVSECQRCGYDKYSIVPASGHLWTEKVITPTCTSSGYTVKTCSNCHDEDIVSFVDPVDHTYTEETEEYIAPTCTGLGKKVSYCSCGAQKVETVESTGHIWETEFTTDYDATCTTKGQQSIHCSVCDVINTETITEIDIKGHTWGEEVCEQKESCGIKGLYVKTCEVCQENSSRITDALIHKYNTETVPATCTEAGKKTTSCEICGEIKSVEILQPLTHEWDNGATTSATCTSSAYITYTCQRDGCYETYIEIVENSTTLPHDFTGAESNIVNATCTADGSKTVQCKNCEQTINVAIPKLGHAYPDTWTVVKEATNSEDGKWTRTCANCTNVEEITIPAGGHNFVEDKAQYVAPTCNTKGQRVYECSAHNDCIASVTVELDYAQHTVAQRTNKEASCTEKGEIETYCTVCSKSFFKNEVAEKAHNPVAGEAVAPTCTTSGYTPYACECGTFSYNLYDASKPATGHVKWGETGRENATCTKDGSVSYKCEKCTATKTEVLPKTGHNFVEDTAAATSATCTALATKTYKCSCGASYVEHYGTLAAHKFDTLVKTVPATNDSLGYEERKCACGLTEITILEATGTHVFDTKIENECVAPTCTENGTDVYKCTAHTNCTAKSSVLVPRLGHKAKAEFTASTCLVAGSSKAVCETCGETLDEKEIPVIGYHNFSGEGEITTAATCTDAGTMTYTCQTDGCTVTKTETIPEKGHTFATVVNDAKCGEKGSVVTSCTTCNDPKYTTTVELGAKGHIWGKTPTETVEAKCETDGSETYKCENCNETNVVVIPKLGHDWGDWTVTKASTNTEKGTLTRTCSRDCTETVDIPAGNHNLVVDTDKSTPATCKTEGITVYKCENHTDCGITLSVAEPMLQHTVAQREIEATCKAEGRVEAYCTVCKDVLSTEVIPVKAHNFVAQTPAVEATCTTSGYTVYKCTCGDTYNVYDATKPAKGHKLVEGTSTASCTTAGRMTLTCSDCADYTTSVAVPALGHNYVEDITAATEATCAAPATKTYKCSCGKSYTVSVGEKLSGENDHKWGAWVTKEAATATSIGYKTSTCEVCGQVKVEKIGETGSHSFTIKIDEESKAPTCTEDGYDVFKCSSHTDCPEKTTLPVPATGHKETLDYKAATCDEKGYARMVCSVEACKAVISNQEIPALGHLYGDGAVTNATCKAEGKIVYTCIRENCTDKIKTVTIPKNEKAHQYETVVTPSTCTKAGSVVTKCTLCDDVTTNKELPVVEHSWGTPVVENATCIKDGSKVYTCECGATKTETVAKLGHDWGDWTVTKASSNNEKGTLTRTCSRDCTETVDIPAGGHNLVVSSKTEATCTAPGSVTYTCDTAHEGGVACGITVTVTLDKLQHKLVTNYDEKATCEADGKVVTKCEMCDTTTITTIIPATGHSYVGKVNDGDEATCTKEGTKTYTCSKCNGTYTEPLPKLRHKYVASAPVPATCTKSGYTTYTCECGAIYDESNEDALGHDIVITPAGATCTKSGTVVVACRRCEFKQEVTDAALGHDYKKIGSTKATCAAAATETYECSRCEATYTVSVGGKATEHSYPDAWTVVKEATSVSIGYKTRECTVCGKLEVQTINATGEHVFEGGDVVESKAATCTENGYEIRKCKAHTDCGLTTEITLFATGHDEIVTTTAASCEGEGSIVTTCSKCTYKNTETISALGHVWGNEKVTPATCTEAGKIEYTCTRDNCSEKRTVVIDIDEDAHDLVTTVEQATCTKAGKVTVSCKNKDCNYSEETATIPVKAHEWSDTASEAKDATCEGDGFATYKCKHCEAENTVIIPAIGHVYEAGEKVAATCTTSGYTVYTCKHNAEHKYNVYDAAATAVPHTWKKTDEVKADCTTNGSISYKCENCTATKSEIVPATGHDCGGWETVKNPTAEEEGTKRKDCAKCDYYEEVTLPKLGHDMVKDEAASTAPTCTTTGTDVYVCVTHKGDEACGYTYNVTVAAKGHTYGEGVVNKGDEATCDKDGVKTFTCTCGSIITEVVPKTGHVLSTTVTEATCQAEGSAVTKCANCDYSITEKLAVKPHTLSLSTAYPGCEKEGYATTRCSVCNTEIHRETLAALGHSFTGEETVTKEATCLEKGEKTVKCSRCDKTTTVEIPATGHNYVAGEEVKATCTTSGYIPYECKNAGCSSSYRDLTSNPNGHKWNTTAVSETKATCDTDGIAVYKCQFCEATNEVVTPKFGHSWTEWTISKAPTATENGEQTRTCLRGCEETAVIPALGTGATYTVKFVVNGEVVFTQTVNYLSSATAPTVAEKESDDKYHYVLGWDKDFSSVTSDLTVNAVFTPVSHTFGEWVIDKVADCKNAGLRHRVCACGYVQSEVIAETEHDFSEIAEEKAPTCTTNGYKVVVCKNCGDSETKTINKLGHSMTYYQGYDATCDTDGVARHYSCSRCGKSFEDRAGNKELTTTVITRKYHTYVVVPGTAPGCDTEGVTDYRYCTACGYTQQPEPIPATGHADANKDNTCDKCGSTYMQGGNIICSCSCHKNGFFNELIYKILSFFWRLFGTNKSCECGKVHY